MRGDRAALGEALHRETSGNPFFLGEVVRLLDERTLEAGRDAWRIPQSVREVVARRLDRLSEACRATLAVAALLGETIEAPVLGELLDGAPAVDHLEEAARNRILIEVVGRPGRYRFAHALIRRVLVDELAPVTRRSWHGRIAALLERCAAGSAVATTELVRHLSAAGEPEALRKAFDHARRAGEEAARGLGWEEAVRLFELALDLAERSHAADAACHAEIRLALARALRGAGDVPAARARCAEEMAAARRTGDARRFARAALVHAGPIPEWGRVEPEARAILEEAARAADALDDELRARILGRLAGDLVAANEIGSGDRISAPCEDAAAAARRAGAAGPLAQALLAASYAESLGGRPGPSYQSLFEALQAAEAAGEHGAAIRHGGAMRILSLGKANAFSSAVDGFATAAALTRVPESVWLADALSALRACLQGRFAEAHEAMERAFLTGRRAQLPNAVAVHVNQRIMWHAFHGRLAEIAPEIEAAIDEQPMGRAWRPFRALARLAAGDSVAARAEYAELLAGGLVAPERLLMSRAYFAGLAALCVALRDREHASALYECLTRRPYPWTIDGCVTLGPWALFLGGLARLCGRPDDAARHLEHAIELGRRMGAAPIVARAPSQLASPLLANGPASGERERVGALLAEAGQCARALGLADVEARVARLEPRLTEVPAAPVGNAFCCEGEVWRVSFAGRELRLRDGKGPRYLATLLASPGPDVHVLQLAGGGAAAPAVAPAGDELRVGSIGAALEDAPDADARRQYRARVGELREELEEAEQMCDLGRADRIRAELDFLLAQLAQSFGARSRTRGPAETARKAVGKVLRTQIEKLLQAHAPLGEHLRESLRLGTFCSYTPRTPVDWEVSFPPR